MEPYLSVIIPAYNEEKRIGTTLVAVEKWLKTQSFSWEVVIAIDGAKDGTARIAQTFAAGKDNVHVIDRKENKGKGYTVREGMLLAKGQVRLFTDADNSTDIGHFAKMKPLFDAGKDIVICSRDSKDAPGARQAVPQPALKRLMGNMGNLFIQIVAVYGIWDTQCGFKAFNKKSAEKIFAVSKIDRWGFDIEALALARHFKFSIGIVDAYWVNDTASHVKLSGYIGVLWETVKVRGGLITRQYDK